MTDTKNLQHTIDVVYGARRGIIDRLHSAVIGTHSVSREHLNGQGIVLFYIHIYKKPKEIIQVTTSKPSNSPNWKLPVEWLFTKVWFDKSQNYTFSLGNPSNVIYTIVYCSLILLEYFPIYLGRRLVILWI